MVWRVSIHAPLRGATYGHFLAFYDGEVSIHAPLRGATEAALVFWNQLVTVSIHAPLRGATYDDGNLFTVLSEFQSTHPCGVRLTNLARQCPDRGVSIHAPLRGATLYSLRSNLPTPRFQSTHPCGVRPQLIAMGRPHRRFNPRTPAGCDGSLAPALWRMFSFNPRTPAGCDEVIHCTKHAF